MRAFLLFTLAILPACGGGSGGGGPPGPPGPPYSDTTSTGLAIATGFKDAAALGQLVLSAVSESEMGADLNGDGDMLDRVMHEVDVANDINTNLQLATVGPVLVSDQHFAFSVVEGSQGIDLNGDTDIGDAVWFVYNPAIGLGPTNPLNTGLATPPIGLPGAGTTGGFVLPQSEASAGVVLNADGDQLDIIPMIFDSTTFTVSTAVAPAQAPGTPLVARNGRVLVASSETAAAADQNGDGDQQDTVLGFVEFNVGPGVYRPMGNLFARSIANHPYALTDGAAVYFVDEASEAGLDLNNDADALDAVIAIFNIAGGTGETLPLTPSIPSFAVAGAPAVGIGVGPNRAIVAISEAAQGPRDINGDMDMVDSILGWVDTGAPATIHLTSSPFTLAQMPPVIDGTRGVVAVSEAAMTFFGIDLNADGDTSDNVAYLLDTAVPPGLMINLNFAVATTTANGGDVLLGVFEPFQGGIDFNGNGIINDVVQFYFDIGDSPHTMRGLGIVTNAFTFDRTPMNEVRIAARMQEGQSPTFGDLNRDGDLNDVGLMLITIDATENPPTLVQPTPFFAGTAAPGSVPPIRIDDATFVFPTDETMDLLDHNGDGDMLDTVLRYTRIRPPVP